MHGGADNQKGHLLMMFYDLRKSIPLDIKTEGYVSVSCWSLYINTKLSCINKSLTQKPIFDILLKIHQVI